MTRTPSSSDLPAWLWTATAEPAPRPCRSRTAAPTWWWSALVHRARVALHLAERGTDVVVLDAAAGRLGAERRPGDPRS
jgi:hypothetical protein